MAINKGYLTAKTNKEDDEWYTPEIAVKPLLKYIPKNSTIWCPFDKEKSAYVRLFKENGYNVIHSHIDDDKNFFFYEPSQPYDFIISNPPFSIKDLIIRRLYELNKPYAILAPLPTLQGQKRFPYMKDCQALIFRDRIRFCSDEELTKVAKNPPFASIYICKNFLPKDLIMEEINI